MDSPGDPGRLPRLREALAGGYWASAEDVLAAQSLEAACPGARSLPGAAWDFHRRAALQAVQEQEHALPAQWVIFTDTAHAPSEEPLHGPAAEASPSARFLYCAAGREAALLNHILALRDPARVAAAEADEEDPDAVMDAARDAGIPVDCPGSVHVLAVPQFWPGTLARGILARYRELLAPGSTVCLTLAVIDEGPAGDAFLAAVSAAGGGRAFRHLPQEVASWVEDAGMTLHPAGVGCARTWGRQRRARDRMEPCLAVRLIAAVGIVPWRS